MSVTNNVPEECRAAVVSDEGPNFSVQIEMVKVPSPGPDEVLVKLSATGICYSDIHYMLNDTGGRKMSAAGVRSAGHEGSGIVVKIGANVKRFHIGDRVGVKPIWNTCGSCDLCWSGKDVHCSRKALTGVDATGTFQQYIVSPERYTTRIPEGIPHHIAATAMCSAATAYRSVKESGLPVGSWATFIGGGGGVGIQAVQIAKAFGLRPIVVDTGSAKRDLSLRMGAEAFVDFKESSDHIAEVVRLTDGIGSHGVFVTAPAAYPTAVRYLGTRVGAIVMCIGLPAASSDHIIPVNPGIRQSRVCEILPFEKLPEGVERLRSGQVAGKLVIDYDN